MRWLRTAEERSRSPGESSGPAAHNGRERRETSLRAGRRPAAWSIPTTNPEGRPPEGSPLPGRRPNPGEAVGSKRKVWRRESGRMAAVQAPRQRSSGRSPNGRCLGEVQRARSRRNDWRDSGISHHKKTGKMGGGLQNLHCGLARLPGCAKPKSMARRGMTYLLNRQRVMAALRLQDCLREVPGRKIRSEAKGNAFRKSP